MQTSRRSFLRGLLALPLAPLVSKLLPATAASPVVVTGQTIAEHSIWSNKLEGPGMVLSREVFEAAIRLYEKDEFLAVYEMYLE